MCDVGNKTRLTRSALESLRLGCNLYVFSCIYVVVYMLLYVYMFLSFLCSSNIFN